MWARVIAFFSRLRFVLTRQRLDDEARAEFEAHLALLTDRYIRAGMTPETARAAARRQFGNTALIRDDVYRINTVEWIDRSAGLFLRELHQAMRNLKRSPRFSLACIFTLALALAGTATLLNLLEAFVLRRLAVPSPEQLVGVYPATGDFSVGFSEQALKALSDRQQVLTGVCGVTAGYGALSVQFESGASKRRPAEAVTGNCYELLGVKPSIGRLLTPTDESLTGNPARVVVISDHIWQREFGSSPDVLGRIVKLEGTPLTIIGVLPSTYHGMNADEAPDIAVPLTLPWVLNLQPPLAMRAIGRLRPEITIGEASAHLSALWPDLFRSGQPATAPPAIPDLRVSAAASGFSVLREQYRRPLYVLAALAGCLLLLACVNTGGLSLARLLDRRDAFAVQLALGAGRARLAIQVLAEAMLLSAAAALIAVPAARWSAQAVGRLLWTGYRPQTLTVTPLTTSLFFTISIALLAALVVSTPGLIALAFQNWDLAARSVGHGGRARRRGVVAVQIALSFVLAFCAALFAGNLKALRQLPLGYESRGLQYARLDATSRISLVPTIGYVDTLLSRVEALPGVEFAAMSQGDFGSTPLLAGVVPVRINGADVTSVGALVDLVSPGFFRTMSIPLQQGRDFTWTDVSSRSDVVILNRSLADRLSLDDDAVGRTVTVRNAPRQRVLTVIGIAATATPGDPRIQNMPEYFLPLSPVAPPSPALLLRVRTGRIGDASLRDAIEPLGRHQVVHVSMMADQVERFLVQEQLITTTSLLFAILAGVVSIAGLYAALSQNIIGRIREIGIRIAVGATPGMIRTLVLSDALWIIVIGLGFGVPAALAGGRAARSLLSGALPNSTTLLALTGLLIGAVAILVSAWPAQRAARTHVATALRTE